MPDGGSQKKEVVEVIVMGKVDCGLCDELSASLKRVVESSAIQSIPGMDVRFRSLKAMPPEEILLQSQEVIEEQRDIYVEMAWWSASDIPSVIVRNGHVLLRETSINDLRRVTGGDVKRAIKNAVGGLTANTSEKVQCRETADASR